MSDAYVETTVLTDILLKPQSDKQKRAKAALQRYDRTMLPVYSIKEWKAGPLKNFAYVHNKLVLTQSLADTLQALSTLSGYLRSTAMEALAAAGQISKSRQKYSGLGNTDADQADSFRISLATLITLSWRKRRHVTSEVVDDLPCYLEAAPRIGKDGTFELEPRLCERDEECGLATELKSNPETLKALRAAIPENSTRREDIKRRQALKQLIKHPKDKLTRELCRDLGDAIFAFFCPQNAVILTTNIRDHQPLAEAVGKSAEKP